MITIDYDYIVAWELCNGINCYNPMTGHIIKKHSKTYKECDLKYQNERAKLGNPYGPCIVCNGMQKTSIGYCTKCLGKKTYFTPVGYDRENVKVNANNNSSTVPTGHTNQFNTTNSNENIKIDYKFIRKWRSNQNVNPETGMPIKYGGPTWQKWNKLCIQEEKKMGSFPFINCASCGSTNKTSDGYCAVCIEK